jgi:CelD/BcsL family acetyltransferase involved in cellulose biosynthesis
MPTAAFSGLSLEATERAAPVESLDLDDPGWLRFVESQAGATVFHHPAWSNLLASSYGRRAFVLAQRSADGAVSAGLPALEMRGSSAGRQIRALPLTDHCPPLTRSPRQLNGFSRGLLRWMNAHSVERLTVHGALAGLPGINLAGRALRHQLSLEGGIEMVRERLRGGPVERAIRKAQRQRLQVRISRAPADLAPFYRLHLLTRRRLGVPVQPFGFIRKLWKTILGDGLGFVVIASHDGEPVAASLFLAWNRNLIYKYGASDTRYWPLRPNQLVIWTAIEWACARGYRSLDLGRTDFENQGLRDFKLRWGAVEQPLVYSYIGCSPSEGQGSLPVAAVGRLLRVSPPIVCRLAGEAVYRYVMARRS